MLFNDGQQMVEVDRFGEQRGDIHRPVEVKEGRARGQHNDRDASPGWVGPLPRAKVPSVQNRYHQIEHDEAWERSRSTQQGQRVCALLRTAYDIALVGQERNQDGANISIVFHKQNVHARLLCTTASMRLICDERVKEKPAPR
jgi:hypothetical protein